MERATARGSGPASAEDRRPHGKRGAQRRRQIVGHAIPPHGAGNAVRRCIVRSATAIPRNGDRAVAQACHLANHVPRGECAMSLKALLTVTALVELGSGIALLIVPSIGAQLLVSAPLDSAQLAVIGRFAGAALTAIGVICWLESRIERADSRAGLLLGLLTYNVAA